MGLVLVLLGSVLLVLCWAWLLLGSFLGVLCWSLVLGCSLGDSCHLAMHAIVWQMVSLVLGLVLLSCYLLLWGACA